MKSSRVLLVVALVRALVAASCSGKPANIAPNANTATPIQHLVVIFQENVSFDHYFGTYPNAANGPGEPAFHALPGTPTPNNYLSNPSLLTNNPNKDSKGATVNPYRLGRDQAVTCDQDHDYDHEQ